MSFLNTDNLSDDQILDILLGDGQISESENLSEDEYTINEATLVENRGLVQLLVQKINTDREKMTNSKTYEKNPISHREDVAPSGKLITETELQFSQLTQLSQTFNMTSEEHLSKCKEVLTTDQGIKEFTYHLEENFFVWKKKILTDMKIKFGQIEVQKFPVVEARKDIMDTLLLQNKEFKSKVGIYEQETEKLKSENSQLQQTLEEFTESKVRHDRILYGKFAALINTKKQRIVCLEKLLFKNLCADEEEAKAVKAVDRINYDSDTEPEDDVKDASPQPGPSRHCTIEDIECDTENTTDEDTPPCSHYSPHKASPVKTPGSSSRVNEAATTSGLSNTSHYKSYPNEILNKELSGETLAKKLKLCDKNSESVLEIQDKVPLFENKKLVNEMDSQELLDLL